MEIERKWLIAEMPDLSALHKLEFERYFVYIGEDVEIRVQRVNDRYSFERKQEQSSTTRDEQRLDITPAEFSFFKSIATKGIRRDAYELSRNPDTSIKIYHGDYEGLVRVEVEFQSEDDARSFIPPSWFGPEITETALGRDKNLIRLSREEFKRVLREAGGLIG
jgi:adenylate cyclase